DRSVALRTSSGSRRRSSPSSSIRSNVYRNILPSWQRYRIRSSTARPLSSQATASPMHDRGAKVSQRLDNQPEAEHQIVARTDLELPLRPVPTAAHAEPSCLISRIHSPPEGSVSGRIHARRGVSRRCDHSVWWVGYGPNRRRTRPPTEAAPCREWPS